MSVSVKMDAKELAKLNRAFKDLAKISDKPVEDLLRSEGRLLAVALANRASRKGDTKETGLRHEAKVEQRIRGVYSPPLIWVKIVSKTAGIRAGNEFDRMLRGRQTSEAESFLAKIGLATYKGRRVRVIMFDRGTRHRNAIENKIKKSEYYVVCDYKKVEAYIRKSKKRVGNLKSGWARAAEMLRGAKGKGTRGIPNWAMGKGRLHDNKGVGRVTGSKGKNVLFLSNKYQGRIPDKSYGARAIRDRVTKIKVRLEKSIEKELKRLNRKYK